MLKEEEYQELHRLSKQLYLPAAEAFLALETRDRDGIITDVYRQRSHTWVRNLWNQVIGNIATAVTDTATFGAGHINWKSTAATITNLIVTTAEGGQGSVAAGNTNYGILVGTGTTAWSFEDYALATKIAHGTGSGQLSYAGQVAPSLSWNSGTRVYSIQIQRQFSNNSAGSITINEVGFFQNVAAAYIMMCRDVLAVGKTLAPGANTTASYVFTLTYP